MKINNFKFDENNKSILIDTNDGIIKLHYVNNKYSHFIRLKSMSRVLSYEFVFLGKLYEICDNYIPMENEKTAHSVVLSHLKQTFK